MRPRGATGGGSFTRAPTGFRRLTPGLLKADRTAEGFAGLPQGVTSPGQLFASLKAAAPRLGIAPRLVHAVDWLFRFTQPQDWERGARPVVWPSASMQQEALGLSPTQVKEINRRLIELGLVTMKDSPNGRRYGKRDPKGRIVEAYGFDLAPIATRHAEFRRHAEEERAERLAMGRLRRRATIARKAIIQILETGAEYAIEGEEWQTLARETEALARAEGRGRGSHRRDGDGPSEDCRHGRLYTPAQRPAGGAPGRFPDNAQGFRATGKSREVEVVNLFKEKNARHERVAEVA